MTARAELVIRGRIVLAAAPVGIETAEAIAIADGLIVAAGSRDDVSAQGARVIDAGDAAVVPGIHDFHLHLAGLARARGAVRLDDARDAAEVADRLAAAASIAKPGDWITGRGWTEAQLATGLAALDAAVGEHPAFLSSHDGHSAWTSAAARRIAGLGQATPDPAGGRIERDPAGHPMGILRETALDLVASHVARAQGDALRGPMDATLRELAGFGITAASEAGDYTDANGTGPDADLGDSYSSLTELADMLDGRLRMTLGIPADAIAAAAARGLRTGKPLEGRRTMRFGWAKVYADGALGSGTAALLAPRTCGQADTGILRVTDDGLDALLAASRPAAIGMAIHAIGDRAGRTVLDAIGRAAPRRAGVPTDRVEHVQLLEPADAARFASLGVTASVQPIHAAADRDLVEACWGGRQSHAYAWRRLASGGALLAAGSDAPVESVDPWLGIFAAVHRRLPTDARPDWHPAQALTFAEALSAYTLGPALAIGAADEGHLRVGARADLAVLTHDLASIGVADEALEAVRADLTIIGGEEVHRS